MTESPRDFAIRPNADNGLEAALEHVDLLSELLAAVRLRGDQVLDYSPPEPFALSFDHSGGTLHIVERGELELEIEGSHEVHRLAHGDVVLLAGGQRHTLRSAGGRPRWLCGTFIVEDARAAQILASLPPLIELEGVGGQSLVWLDVSCQMLHLEMSSPTQGSVVMVWRILDLLLIQVLRHWASQTDAEPGWLAGAMDPVIGKALAGIHADPAQSWTVDRLARTSHISRSSFAELFVQRVGQPPAAYVTEVRLTAAAARLRESTEPVHAIASKVGYASEAAFSRAFSRRYGEAPSRWRRAQRQR
jgi:AraC-like DNA-binding protein